jgi:hypothetical protein
MNIFLVWKLILFYINYTINYNMRRPSENTTAKQTLSIIVNPSTYQLLHQEIGKGKISRFVEELIIKKLGVHEEKIERKQKEFKQKLIASYKRSARSKALRKEDEI